MHRKGNFAAAAVAIGCAVLIIGCGKKTEQATTTNSEGQTSSAASGKSAATRNMALVRFVNAIPGRSVDLWFGQTQAFTDVDFKSVTPYREIPAAKDDFKLTAAKGSEAEGAAGATENEGLNSGVHYTVVASVDEHGKEKINVITDNLAEPPSGQAKVRVINASTTEVNVLGPHSETTGEASRSRVPPSPAPGNARNARNAAELFGGVDAGSATDYKDIAPVSAALQVLPAERTDRHMVKAVDVPVEMEAGKLYTLVITRGEEGKMDVIKIADSLNMPAEPAESPAR